jgi:hypothetical protein
MSNTNKEEFEVKVLEQKNTAFAAWMKNPATKMFLSMIPASEPPEITLSLLQATFEEGFERGFGFGLAEMVTVMLTTPPKKT